VELEQELTGVFRRALLSADFIGGTIVEEFEKAFAAFCGTTHSIAVSSGTLRHYRFWRATRGRGFDRPAYVHCNSRSNFPIWCYTGIRRYR
jgi:hypothetical protein